MIAVQDVVRELCKMGVGGISIHYNEDKDMLYYDLNTRAKSELHLYEDFHVEGRYGYTKQINSGRELKEIISELFWEFRDCMCGQEHYNQAWMDVGVALGYFEKKVSTHTTVEYV